MFPSTSRSHWRGRPEDAHDGSAFPWTLWHTACPRCCHLHFGVVWEIATPTRAQLRSARPPIVSFRAGPTSTRRMKPMTWCNQRTRARRSAKVSVRASRPRTELSYRGAWKENTAGVHRPGWSFCAFPHSLTPIQRCHSVLVREQRRRRHRAPAPVVPNSGSARARRPASRNQPEVRARRARRPARARISTSSFARRLFRDAARLRPARFAGARASSSIPARSSPTTRRTSGTTTARWGAITPSSSA